MTKNGHEITADCAWDCASCGAPIACYHLTDLCTACLADATEIGASGADFDDACEATVTREQAQREIAKHPGCGTVLADGTELDGWTAFVADCGDRPTYRGADVLGWLGY